MQYSAATVTAATRPIVITLGRVVAARASRAQHPYTWWLGALINAAHAWWLRHARTWTLHRISTPQMLSLQAVSRSPHLYLNHLGIVLRAVFPRRWRDRVLGDPVRRILTLPEDVRQHVLRELVTIPGSTVDHSREADDPLAAVREAQRRMVRGTASARHGAPSLAVASLIVRAHFGESWYYDPRRWPTSDGYAPFALVWLELAGLEALGARRRLEIADGYALPHSKDLSHLRRLREQALPREVH